jgi:alanine racemase
VTRAKGSAHSPVSNSPMPADPSAPAFLTVDLGALVANYKALAARAPGAECGAAVKADAYGIGADRAVPALADAGCRTFFVATLAEARVVREVAREADSYVLDGLFPDTAPAFAEIGARPVLGSLPEIKEWAAFCSDKGEPLAAAIHVDTGMNRLGLRAEEVAELARDEATLKAISPALVMSHLACADEPANPMNEAQRRAFDVARAELPPMPASLANSAGIFLGEAHHYDLVRPGIALYGGRATGGAANPMKPVVRLEARIAQVREAGPGDTVGYGATRTLARRTLIATVAAGYADGIFRRLGAGDGEEGLTAWIGDHAAPILGRVSMDLITLDATDVPSNLVARGALVELLGDHVAIDDLADKAGTIGYEVLTSLGRRHQRRYTDY